MLYNYISNVNIIQSFFQNITNIDNTVYMTGLCKKKKKKSPSC